MHINLKRLMEDIQVLSSFNETTGEGCTRFSYSEEDKKARNYIINEMNKIGLKVTVDPVGNIRGKLEGKNPNYPSIMSGSHIDTVFKGGKYDGVLGVVCALEVARVLVEHNIILKRPYEVIVFTEEEGSNFGYNLVGSKVLTGECNLEKIKDIKTKSGQSMYNKIKELELNPDNLDECVLKLSEVKGLVELHIEQGSVLDIENKTVGIVNGIVGLQWYEIEIKGKANHAGATPMPLRKDSMVASSQIISQLPSILKEKGDETTVATVGRILCKPNAINVIPESVKFTIDIRGMNPDVLKNVIDEISIRLKILEKEGFDCKINLLTKTKEVKLSDDILDIIEEEAKKEKISYKRMYSGSNHDSSIMAQVTDVAMIFVPSVEGRSHCPEEYTKDEDIKNGCRLLFKTIVELTKY